MNDMRIVGPGSVEGTAPGRATSRMLPVLPADTLTHARAGGGRSQPAAPDAPFGLADLSLAEVLLIAGAHRSGTSVLAAEMARHGYALPVDRRPGAPDNPGGHNEPAAVVALNDAILAADGRCWDSVLTDPPDAAADYSDDITRALRRSFPDGGRVVVKDPRLSLTLPHWRKAVEAAGVPVRLLIALRAPGAVAASLARRDGIDVTQGLMIWAAQTLAVLVRSAGMRRQIALFPGWATGDAPMPALSDLQSDHVGPASGASGGSAGPGGFNPTLLRPGPIPGRTDDTPIAAFCDDLFQRLSGTARRRRMPPQAAVREFQARFAELTAASAAAERRAMVHLKSLSARLAATEAQRDAASGQIRHEAASARSLQQQLAATEAQRDDALRRGAEQAQSARSLQARLAATEAQRDTGVAQLDRTAAALAAEVLAREGADAAVRETWDRTAQLSVSLAESQAETRYQRDLSATAADQAARAQEALGTCQAERDSYAEALAEADRDMALISADLARAGAERDRLDDAVRRSEVQIATLAARCRQEQLTVLAPALRNLRSVAGQGLRRVLTHAQVERLKALLPGPGGSPAALSGASCDPGEPGFAGGAPEVITPRPVDGPCDDIFIFSIIAWDFRTQRPQHLAREFAARGHRVFYIEMETDLSPAAIRTIAPGLWIVRLGARGVGLIPTYTGVPRPDQTRRWIDAFTAFCARVGASPTRQLVVQHPYWWEFLRHLPAENRITFDCMDDLSGFSNTLPHVLEAEAEMTAHADRMIVSSGHLQRRHDGGRTVALVRNAASVAHFARADAAQVPAWLGAGQDPAEPHGGGLRVGYVGAIAEWFDTDLVAAAARMMPDAEFHLCGAVTDPAALALGKLANVRLYGEVPYADVPGFAAAMDVMTIPFRLTPIIEACDPVKFYEHCAAGRPTVATPMPELARAGDLVFRAADAGAFAAAIRAAAEAGRDDGYAARLRRYADENTWTERAGGFLQAMLHVPKVSVVILSYGDVTLTLAALRSLTEGGGAYPALEIVVADNGSDAAALARLRSASKTDARIRLIENGRNLGFAAGNNRGIAAATGEYVLLLNNDTYVAPGAVSAMVAHLERDPGIGVVGPLTNAIGNEARVAVAYADMEEMTAEMRRVTTGYRAQATDIRVAAYFCAMLRRRDFERFGLLAEVFGQGMFEDDDHCAEIRAQGYRCVLAEDAFVHHHLSASFDALGADRRRGLFDRNRALFEARRGPWVPHAYRTSRPAPTLEPRR